MWDHAATLQCCGVRSFMFHCMWGSWVLCPYLLCERPAVWFEQIAGRQELLC
jgi:hypothetical protein